MNAKLKVAIMIPPTLRPTAAWDSRGGLLVTRGGLERYFWVTGQGRKPRPGLGSLPWPAPLWAPFTRMLEAQDGPPPGAPGCCGPQSGWNHYGYFQFLLHFEFYLNELHDEVLEIFFAGNTKENCKSLKLVSVHYRNKAWINNIGVLSF